MACDTNKGNGTSTTENQQQPGKIWSFSFYRWTDSKILGLIWSLSGSTFLKHGLPNVTWPGNSKAPLSLNRKTFAPKEDRLGSLWKAPHFHMEGRASTGLEETVEVLTCPRNGASLNSQLPLLSQVPTSQGPILAAVFSLSSLRHFSSNRNPLIYPVLPSWSGVNGSQHHCSLDPGAGPSYLIYRPSGVHIQLSGGSLCTHCYLTSTEFSPRWMITDCIPGPKADNLQCKSAVCKSLGTD